VHGITITATDLRVPSIVEYHDLRRVANREWKAERNTWIWQRERKTNQVSVRSASKRITWSTRKSSNGGHCYGV